MGQQSKLATVLVVLAVLLAGCAGMGGDGADGGDGGGNQLAGGGGDGAGGDGGDGGDGSGAADAPVADGDSGAPGGDGGGDGQRAQSSDIQRLATDRSIIRTGTVAVEVDDFETERNRLGTEVTRLGGYVGGSNVELHRQENETWRTGSVTLRVPAESFSRMLSYAKDRGEVLSEQTSTKDVTDQLVELEARIENLEGKRTRLRAFYEDANSTDALLRIEDRLSEVQGQIEQLKAKQRSLEDRVTYATLTVDLREPTPEASKGPGSERDRAGVLGTLRDSFDGLVGFAYGGLLVAAAAVPWILAILLLLGLLAGFRRVAGRAPLRTVFPWTGGAPNSTAGSAPAAHHREDPDRHSQPTAPAEADEPAADDSTDLEQDADETTDQE
jgi:hypothetical protein